MKTAKVLRWIAWVFLLGITATVIGAIPTSPHPYFARISMTTFFQFGLLNLHLTSARLHAELRATLLGFQFLLGFQNTSKEVIFSTVAIGYLLSFVAARKARAARTFAWFLCYLLSALGLLGFVNEALRLATHHDLRFLVSCPPLLVLFDWLHNRQGDQAAARAEIRLVSPN